MLLCVANTQALKEKQFYIIFFLLIFPVVVMSTQMIVTILYFIYLIGVFIINFLGYSARNYSSWMSVFTLLSSWNQGAIFHS